MIQLNTYTQLTEAKEAGKEIHVSALRDNSDRRPMKGTGPSDEKCFKNAVKAGWRYWAKS